MAHFCQRVFVPQIFKDRRAAGLAAVAGKSLRTGIDFYAGK